MEAALYVIVAAKHAQFVNHGGDCVKPRTSQSNVLLLVVHQLKWGHYGHDAQKPIGRGVVHLA